MSSLKWQGISILYTLTKRKKKYREQEQGKEMASAEDYNVFF